MLDSTKNNISNTLSPGTKQAENRIEDLVNAITQARQSLQNWQDKKTEALIQLDSITFDMRALEHEKRQVEELNYNLQQQLETQERNYHGQIESLTDQLQELKFQIESLEKKIEAQEWEIDCHQKTIESERVRYKTLEGQQNRKVAEARSELEIQISDLKQRAREKDQAHSQELGSTMRERDAANARVKQLELELTGIRSQMMSVLKVSEAPAARAQQEEVKRAPVVTVAATNIVAKESKPDESKKLRAVEIEPGTVEDYLRRFGY